MCLELVDLVVDSEFVGVLPYEAKPSHYEVGARYRIGNVDGVIAEHQTECNRDDCEGTYRDVYCKFKLDHVEHCHLEDEGHRYSCRQRAHNARYWLVPH